MLNPKYQRYADRLRELVAEGQTVAKSTVIAVTVACLSEFDANTLQMFC